MRYHSLVGQAQIDRRRAHGALLKSRKTGVGAMAEGYFIRKGDKTSAAAKCWKAIHASRCLASPMRQYRGRVVLRHGQQNLRIEGGRFMHGQSRQARGRLDWTVSAVATAKPRWSLRLSITSCISKVTCGAAPPPEPPLNPRQLLPQPSGQRLAGPVRLRQTKTATPTFSELPGLVCENLWRGYQQRAEAIVAPGGIADRRPQGAQSRDQCRLRPVVAGGSAFPMGGTCGLRFQAGWLWSAACGRFDREDAGGI